MRLAHFYHCYAGGDWRDAVTEHLAALDESGFDGYLGVGIVGPLEQRREALNQIETTYRLPQHTLLADTGRWRFYENVVVWASGSAFWQPTQPVISAGPWQSTR